MLGKVGEVFYMTGVCTSAGLLKLSFMLRDSVGSLALMLELGSTTHSHARCGE